jgi:putative FmdB family regulatory protein
MPLYDYRCHSHGDFELQQKMKDHAKGPCPTCGSDCKQVLTRAPGLDIEAMADAGMPGAFNTSGDRMTRRHRAAGQDWSD